MLVTPIQQKSTAFLVCQNVSEALMAISVGPDQTAPIGAVWSGPTLFASLLKFACYVGQLFAADDFSRRHFQMHFFAALRVNAYGLANNEYLDELLHHAAYHQ